MAARVPVLQLVATRRAKSLFDLVAGFSYSQIVQAAVESGLLDHLFHGPKNAAAIGIATGLSEAAALRLLRAAAALDLAEEAAADQWVLGQQGAVLHANPGAQAMVRHHHLLYADLADPMALLRADRSRPTALSDFWTYARNEPRPGRSAAEYSELMAVSQAMVGREIRATYNFGRHRSVLDIGGGHGRFAMQLADSHRQLRIGLFDLPEVVVQATAQLEAAKLTNRIAVHPGDFFRDGIPLGYDCHTLVRILHDHDDNRAAELLAASRRALAPGGHLVIAEPMAGIPGAEAVQAYFEMYLWAMGSGRPRFPQEIGTMLREAGFTRVRKVPLPQPLISSAIVASF